MVQANLYLTVTVCESRPYPTMKQSTKLLSLVLALIMAFSCMTVIGNAMIVQSETDYDSIDDAALSPEQY